MVVLRRIRCSACLKSMGGTERCQCVHPQPETILLQPLPPLKLKQPEAKKEATLAVQ